MKKIECYYHGLGRHGVDYGCFAPGIAAFIEDVLMVIGTR